MNTLPLFKHVQKGEYSLTALTRIITYNSPTQNCVRKHYLKSRNLKSYDSSPDAFLVAFILNQSSNVKLCQIALEKEIFNVQALANSPFQLRCFLLPAER